MTLTQDELKANVDQIQERIARAAKVAGRNPEDISLVAVSKTKPIELIRHAFDLGLRDFGENRPQELRDKIPEIPTARWHMIGPIQRNKVKYLVPGAYLIHSVDSEKLLAKIDREAQKAEVTADILLQMNISGEDQKQGFEEGEARPLLEQLDRYPRVNIRGLMGMAEFSDDEKLVRGQFARLRTYRELLRGIHPRADLRELSMGMSGDFSWAIAEGSTMLRIGSAIFGERG